MTQSGFVAVASVLLVALVIPLGLAAYRMVKGPAYADRFVAFDMMTAVMVAFTPSGVWTTSGWNMSEKKRRFSSVATA